MTRSIESRRQALESSWFIDSESPNIKRFAEASAGDNVGDLNIAVALYRSVRDNIRYDPYCIRPEPGFMRASAVLEEGRGHCVGKAVLYAALLRASHVPSRIGFADVRNHLSTPRLRQLMGTDVFHYHGYTEVWLEGRWVKATPAFNLSLCEKFGIKPLEFDGKEDSLFHPFDTSGRQHMEYIKDYGPRLDLPFEEMMSVYRRHYPNMFNISSQLTDGDFEAEASEVDSSCKGSLGM